MLIRCLSAAQVNLTDGRLVQFGCVNTTSGQTGCVPGQLDSDIRMASFRCTRAGALLHTMLLQSSSASMHLLSLCPSLCTSQYLLLHTPCVLA